MRLLLRWLFMTSHRHWTPRYGFNRFRLFLYEKEHPDSPWLTQDAVSILSTMLKPTDIGLEWGSGRSTLWFARRIKHLTSVEHDEKWYAKIQDRIKSANILNSRLIYCSSKGLPEQIEKSPYVQVARTFDNDSLDFVLVDGINRDICANVVLEKIRPGGIIVIDNANWYLPCNSRAPASRAGNSTPASEEWIRFLERVRGWRLIWTTSGISDTAIWIKPCDLNSCSFSEAQT